MKIPEVIEHFVAHKQSLGAKFVHDGLILRRFGRAMGDIDIAEVSPQQVRSFLETHDPTTQHWLRQYRALRKFYCFAQGREFVASSPLPALTPKAPPEFVPYIYSRDEIRRLLIAARAYGAGPRFKLQAETLHPLLLTLYGTGLRISEAVSLNVSDVDLRFGLLLIRRTKFYKSRFVPIGATLQMHLAAYAAKRRKRHPAINETAPFFVYRTGERVKPLTIFVAFKQLKQLAGVRRTDGGRFGPRIHDLRHTFAVHRLISWYRQGADVQKLLPQLSTYLGHSLLVCTQRYLTMTPELLREASKRFEQYAQEVNHD